MHIILGEENAKKVSERYTVLNLDLIRVTPGKEPLQAYCVLEDIPQDQIPRIPELQNLHNKLMENYHKQNWDFCEQALEHLFGAWGGEVDSFYDEVKQRVDKYKENPPTDAWDGVINKF